MHTLIYKRKKIRYKGYAATVKLKNSIFYTKTTVARYFSALQKQFLYIKTAIMVELPQISGLKKRK